MKKLYTVLVLIIACEAFAQSSYQLSSQSMVVKLPHRSAHIYPPTEKSIDGTSYLYPEYVLGKVDGFPETYKMRYNANLDEVIFKKDNTDLALLKEEMYGTINLTETNEILKLANYTYKNTAIHGYLFVVAQNENLTIYKKSSIIFTPFKESKNSYDFDKPAAYVRAPDVYFMKKGTSDIVELPTKKNKLIALFPEKKEAINQYFKDNTVDLTDSKDLQKLAKIL